MWLNRSCLRPMNERNHLNVVCKRSALPNSVLVIDGACAAYACTQHAGMCVCICLHAVCRSSSIVMITCDSTLIPAPYEIAQAPEYGVQAVTCGSCMHELPITAWRSIQPAGAPGKATRNSEQGSTIMSNATSKGSWKVGTEAHIFMTLSFAQ